ncbi:MAG: hypothetical protein ACT60Q_29350, partial [Ferrovibrionaceae bacterium]
TPPPPTSTGPEAIGRHEAGGDPRRRRYYAIQAVKAACYAGQPANENRRRNFVLGTSLLF